MNARAALTVVVKVPTYVRYIAASGTALALDAGMFLMLTTRGTLPVVAAGIGYSMGVGAHWLISSRAVFTDRVALDAVERRTQAAMFVLTAIIGLAITMAIVGTADALAGDPRLAKAVAVAVSFQSVWLLRNRIVFR